MEEIEGKWVEVVGDKDWVFGRMEQAWLMNMINIMADGGMWGTSDCVFQVEKERKLLVVVKKMEPPVEGWIIPRTAKVARSIGWRVIELVEK